MGPKRSHRVRKVKGPDRGGVQGRMGERTQTNGAESNGEGSLQHANGKRVRGGRLKERLVESGALGPNRLKMRLTCRVEGVNRESQQGGVSGISLSKD